MTRAAARWRVRTWSWWPVWRWRCPGVRRLVWLPVVTWRRGQVLGVAVSAWLCLVTLVQLSLHPNKLQQVPDGRRPLPHTSGAELGRRGVGVGWRVEEALLDTGLDLYHRPYRVRSGPDTQSLDPRHAEMRYTDNTQDTEQHNELFPAEFERSRRRIQEIGSKQWDSLEGVLPAAQRLRNSSTPSIPGSAKHGVHFFHHYTPVEHQSQIPKPDLPPHPHLLTDIRHIINPSLRSQGRAAAGRAGSIQSDDSDDDLSQHAGHSHRRKSGAAHSPPGSASVSHVRSGGVRLRSTRITSRYARPASPVTAEDEAMAVGTRLKQDGFLEHAYNVTASDLLPFNRTVPDTRPEGCPRDLSEVTSLGWVSVVICTHNEAVSVLRRTVASVLLQTPPQLLHEIIVIDDNSTTGDPQRALAAMEVGINQGKLRLIKTERRLGLVRGRLLGAREAEGSVLVFLDSHCECGPGWLPPLLQALEADTRKVVSPYIDVIRSESFVYTRSPDNLQGDLSWRLEFGWRAIPEEVMTRRVGLHQPIDTPVISGGLFAVSRDYFFTLGGYDEHMDIWGGENMELSFRVWMCGGKMEIIPCSRVGHVFRSSVPYAFPGNRRHTVLRNLARAATVWMDDYSDYLFAAVNLSRDVDIGDVSERVSLRQRLQCRSFQWYLDHVASHMHVPSPHALQYGQFKNRGSLLCLSAAPGPSLDDLHLLACQGGDNQTLQLLSSGQLELGDRCVYPDHNKRLSVSACPHQHPPVWAMQREHVQLVGTDLCVTSVDNEFVRLQPCRAGDLFQQWEPTYTFTWPARAP